MRKARNEESSEKEELPAKDEKRIRVKLVEVSSVTAKKDGAHKWSVCRRIMTRLKKEKVRQGVRKMNNVLARSVEGMRTNVGTVTRR